MVRFSPNLKKVLLIGTVILLGCDVSMLFAQPATASGPNAPQNPQLQQLQSQVQEQIKALQNQSTGSVPAQAAPTNAPPPDVVGANVANQILNNPNAAQAAINAVAPQAGPAANQNQTSSVLPPSPFPSPTPEQSAAAAAVLGSQQLPSQGVAAAANAMAPAGVSAAQSMPALPPPTPNTQPQVQLPSAMAPNGTVSGGVALPSGATATGAAAPTVNVSDEDLNDAAFSAMVQNALPMSPDQIQKLRSMYMASQFAATSSPVTPPRPTATSVFVDLSPGATPPVIRLSQGFVTSLVFVDSTGAPWPITAYDVGNPSAFNIQWDKTSNTLMVQSTVLYTYGNLAVRLKGLDTPVMLTLIPGQKAVDYRVDLRIQGLGPNHQALELNTLPQSTSSDLLNVLDGVPPPGSTPLKVEGGDCQAWVSGGTMYVRTRLNVLSPGWIATLSSADGMHAYEMQPTPMLLVSQNGEVLQLKVEGF